MGGSADGTSHDDVQLWEGTLLGRWCRASERESGQHLRNPCFGDLGVSLFRIERLPSWSPSLARKGSVGKADNGAAAGRLQWCRLVGGTGGAMTSVAVTWDITGSGNSGGQGTVAMHTR